jgi:hypothetical protein
MLRALDELLAAAGEPEPKPKPEEKVEPKKPKASADVVSSKLAIESINGGGNSFALTLTVAEPWHLYANPVGNDTLAESQTTVTVFVDGKKVDAKIEYPKGKEVKDTAGNYFVYEREVKVTGAFVAEKGAVEVRVNLSACKDGLCLPPSVLKVKE